MKFCNSLIICILLCHFCLTSYSQNPISQSKENPNYLFYNGKPIILISSSEHYGSVYNLDFDFKKHLETLAKNKLNYTRVFLGLWELPAQNVFGLKETPFITAIDKHLWPWAKSENKFDLNAFNPAYFERLKAMVAEAKKLNIIVEITLFSSHYMNEAWLTSPFYFKNNVNDLKELDLKRCHTLYDEKLINIQKKLVSKVVTDLNSFPNVIFEIQNEPWSDNPNLQKYIHREAGSPYTQPWHDMVELANDASLAWQKSMAQEIKNTENKLKFKHLISQNIANYSPEITVLDPNISVLNYHYALPEAASQNLKTNYVQSLNETGFTSHIDKNYRQEAWKFILAGGSIYNNLDYSFIVGKEDGTHNILEETPGWGGQSLRNQLEFLFDFINGMKFTNMKPAYDVILDSNLSKSAQVLAQKGKQYAIYFPEISTENITLKIPAGKYDYAWYDPIAAKEISKGLISDFKNVKVPKGNSELVLKIVSKY